MNFNLANQKYLLVIAETCIYNFQMPFPVPKLTEIVEKNFRIENVKDKTYSLDECNGQILNYYNIYKY